VASVYSRWVGMFLLTARLVLATFGGYVHPQWILTVYSIFHNLMLLLGGVLPVLAEQW